MANREILQRPLHTRKVGVASVEIMQMNVDADAIYESICALSSLSLREREGGRERQDHRQ